MDEAVALLSRRKPLKCKYLQEACSLTSDRTFETQESPCSNVGVKNGDTRTSEAQESPCSNVGVKNGDTMNSLDGCQYLLGCQSW